MSEDPRLRIAVIGCGKVSQNMHLPALAKSSRCDLVAVCDESHEVGAAIGDRYSVPRVYDSVDAVLADDSVDAVLIAVGDPLHVRIAEQALRSGKHALVEKPLGANAAECRDLRRTVEATGLKLQVGVMKRHDPGLGYARHAVRELIGPVLSFSAWYRASADRYVDESAVFLPVIRDAAYTRPAYKLDREPYFLATHGAHLFDTIRFIVGEPGSVRAVLGHRGEAYSWHGLIRLISGAVGHFELSVYVESDWAEGLAAFGEHGSVGVETPNPFFLLPSAVKVFDADAVAWRSPRFDQGDPYLRQLDAFAASVLDDAPVMADIDDGIAAMEMIEAVQASVARGGAEVELNRG